MFLNTLWVDERYLQHGIGSMIIREVERIARDKGCRVVTLGTASYMARPFYEKHGYTVLTTLKKPNGYISYSLFIYVREDDNKIVGMIQIRHCFNEYLEKYGGHIGYSVAPSERLKGYGSIMLKLTLPYCKKLGLSRVLITCVKGNIGSRKIILKNSGIYESTVYEPDKDVFFERYWIDL